MVSAARKRRRRKSGSQTKKPWLGGVVLAIGLMVMLSATGYMVLKWWQQQFTSQVSSQVMAFVSSDPEIESPVILMHVTDGRYQPEVWLLPPEWVVNVAGGYGEYPLRSLAPVLLLDGQPPTQVRLALSLALGRVVDQVWVVPGATWPAARLWDQLAAAQTAPALPWWQRRQWQQWFRSWGEVQSETLASLPTTAQWQQWQPDLIRTCPLAVVNATAMPGLATQLGQLLEQSGVFVIRVTDTSQTQSQTQLIIRPESEAACQPVVALLQLLLPQNDSLVSTDAQQADRFRAEAVLIVGDDTSQAIGDPK